MDILGYLNEIRSLAASGQATEHSDRPALERLFTSIDADLEVINEPKRLTEVGAPDFVFNRNGVSVGWCEVKDITKFASGDYSKAQKARYAKGLPNLIYTNGTDFEFIVKGEVTGSPSPNLSPETQSSEAQRERDQLPDELLVFDYIYGVLHSPDYRRTYAQFLKIDFPRIPYPASPAVFAHVAEKGGQLRRLHLMEDAAIGAAPYPFKGEGDGVLVKPAFVPSPL
jgi:hypothetical protein